MESTTNIVSKVKTVREQTGCGLKEAKDAVEATSTVEEAVALIKSKQPKKYATLSIKSAAMSGYLVGGYLVEDNHEVVGAFSTLEEAYQFIGDHLAEGK